VAYLFLGAMISDPKKSSLPVWVLRLVIVAAAALVVFAVWQNLQTFPRTEDAEVRANVVGVAPQVGGSITRIHVTDNQAVKRGDLLFELDARPYEAAAAQAKAHLELIGLDVKAFRDEIAAAEATLCERRAKADYADSHYKRLQPLLAGNFTSADRVQRAQTDAESASALVREAEAAVERARNKLGEFDGRNTRVEQAAAALRDFELKVSYCKIYAPCDGYVTNLQIAPGTYASAGEQIFSLVDSSVWFVLANFRETDLRRIQPGQSARVYLMAQRGKVVSGIVQGIPKAVYPLGTASKATPGGEGVFSQVQPTFDFVQLAQRFPVRILLEGEGDFRMGGRAAVIVDTRSISDAGRLEKLQSVEQRGFTPPAPND
jgi:multidrug efflux system membrane fusion protein